MCLISRFTVDSLSQKKAKISKGTHPWRLSTFEDFTTEVQFVESQPDSELPGEQSDSKLAPRFWTTEFRVLSGVCQVFKTGV